jgi:hypothetical protein
MYSRKIALSLARQFRTCPPDRVRSLPNYHDEVSSHLKICPYCSEDRDAWEALAAGCREFEVEKTVSNEPVAAGQIRLIRPELGQWKNGFYYNPPLVLVLDCRKDTAAVAQVYHDIALAGPGDVILSDLTEGPLLHELFVELWNGFDIRMQMLGDFVFQVSSRIMEDIDQIRYGKILPDWYKMPRPLAENDSRNFFRAIETDVRRVFASAVQKPLEERLTEMLTGFRLMSVSKIMDIIASVAPKVRWPKSPRTVLQALALPLLFPGKQASPPGGSSLSGKSPLEESFVSMEDAVSFSEDSSPFPAAMARLFTFVSGKLVDVQLLSVSILQSEIVDGLLSIGGQIQLFPEGIRETDVYVYLQNTNEFIDAEMIHLDICSGSFLAKFKNPSLQQSGTFVVLMLRSSG